MASKNSPVKTNVNAEQALNVFGASPVSPRKLVAIPIKWEEGVPIILQFLSRKTVHGKDGRSFEVSTFLDTDAQVRTCSFGVSAEAISTLSVGDVIEVIYTGETTLSGGRRMRNFDITLIGSTS